MAIPRQWKTAQGRTATVTVNRDGSIVVTVRETASGEGGEKLLVETTAPNSQEAAAILLRFLKEY